MVVLPKLLCGAVIFAIVSLPNDYFENNNFGPVPSTSLLLQKMASAIFFVLSNQYNSRLKQVLYFKFHPKCGFCMWFVGSFATSSYPSLEVITSEKSRLHQTIKQTFFPFLRQPLFSN